MMASALKFNTIAFLIVDFLLCPVYAMLESVAAYFLGNGYFQVTNVRLAKFALDASIVFTALLGSLLLFIPFIFLPSEILFIPIWLCAGLVLFAVSLRGIRKMVLFQGLERTESYCLKKLRVKVTHLGFYMFHIQFASAETKIDLISLTETFNDLVIIEEGGSSLIFDLPESRLADQIRQHDRPQNFLKLSVIAENLDGTTSGYHISSCYHMSRFKLSLD